MLLDENAPPAEVSVLALVLVGIGAMFLFMGSAFLLVAGIAMSGFLIPAIAILSIGALMTLLAWRIWRKNRVRHEKKWEKEMDRLLCDYCGGQNAEGELQCRFCGAPLR